MPLTATASSSGDTLRQEVVIDGRHRLVTDEPERLGGGDEAPAPHELVPAALAACVVTTIRMYARTKGWDVGEIAVDVGRARAPRRARLARRRRAPSGARNFRADRVANSGCRRVRRARGLAQT